MTPTDRTESFSDGVFAVAVTLLVLNLEVHGVPPGGLASALGREWPHYVAFVVSFLTIAEGVAYRDALGCCLRAW